MSFKKSFPIFLILLWAMVIGWQIAEHRRFVNRSRTALLNRAKDITNTLAIVIRSQRLFGGIVNPDRLYWAMVDLVQSEGLESIVLFNANEEVLFSVGKEIDINLADLTQSWEKWGDNSLTVVNPADLGLDPRHDSPDERTLIMSDDQFHRMRPPGPPPGEEFDKNAPDSRPQDATRETITDATKESSRRDGGFNRRRSDIFRRGGKPPWLSDEEYQSLIRKSGLYGVVIELSTDQYHATNQRDLWARFSIIGVSLLAMVGFWSAWRNLIRSSYLQLRLVRANEMNAHLKEMNLAAAGLAHETRNPLNLVRGFAQIIAKSDTASQDIQKQAMQITEEVDRVTVQLNEFINYSKPCETKPVPVSLLSVIKDVEQTLISDMEDKKIQFKIDVPEITIEADERLLRQVIFNLLLNSVQAVDENGEIRVQVLMEKNQKAQIQFLDNGPGVPFAIQDKIFHPYFTTREKGTGLGLAVVNQIVSAHGWEIHYVPQEARGACFQVSGVKLMHVS